MIDVMTDLETGELQPRQLLYTVSQLQALAGDTISRLDELDKELVEAMADPPATSR